MTHKEEPETTGLEGVYLMISALPHSKEIQFDKEPDGVYCSRCESIGHLLETCPFSPDDSDTLQIAMKRRARRERANAVQ